VVEQVGRAVEDAEGAAAFEFVLTIAAGEQADGEGLGAAGGQNVPDRIADDEGVLRLFADLLLPGGVLHLCCPYAFHPGNSCGRSGEPEDGRHVRDGYTLERYEELLRPNGLEIVKVLGLGSPPLIAADRHVRRIRAKLGEAAAFPFFLAAWPFTRLDYLDPRVPLSLYVQAMRPLV